MTDNAPFNRATRLRTMAHEMLAMADELEEKFAVRKNKLVSYDFASMQALAARASREFLDRQNRLKSFDADTFGEPCWDMLLYLFIKKVEKQRARVKQVTGASGVAATTALRYITLLEEAGFVDAEQSVTDHRVKFLSLTTDGTVRMAQCLSRMLWSESTGYNSMNDFVGKLPGRTLKISGTGG